jgi:hypothetical protein
MQRANDHSSVFIDGRRQFARGFRGSSSCEARLMFELFENVDPVPASIAGAKSLCSGQIDQDWAVSPWPLSETFE